MTNLLSFSSDKIFTVTQRKTLLTLDFEGNLLFSNNFEQPISAITVNPKTNHIAVGVKKEGEGNKPNLFVYTIKDTGLEDFFSFELPHEAIQLQFTDYRSKYTLLALNSGDVDAIDIETRKSTTLLGSIATGTAFLIGNNIIITSDRDARIRYSKYPQTYDILSFGFYHEEFVSTIDFIDDEHIISGDGDGQIVTWDLNGHHQKIKRISSEKTIIRKIVTSGPFIYIIVENNNELLVLNKDSLEIANKIPLNEPPLTIARNLDGKIFVLTVASLLALTESNELKQVHNIELTNEDAALYSLENQRVKCKKIIYKKDKGSEDYEIWRNPEKSPARE